MERAGKVIGKLRIKAVNIAGVRSYHLAPKAWIAAVGKTISSHSRPAYLDGDKLIVEVDDAIWMAQLASLEHAILERISRIVDSAMVRKLVFRVAPMRRTAAVASAPAATLGLEPAVAGRSDEAEDILDPVMRRLYVAARRKATA